MSQQASGLSLNIVMISEPKSILAQDKELSREELEALIREHGQESRPESRLSQAASRPDSRAAIQAEERLDQLQQSLVVDQHHHQQEEMMVTTSREEHQRVSFAGETCEYQQQSSNTFWQQLSTFLRRMIAQTESFSDPSRPSETFVKHAFLGILRGTF